MIRRAGRKQRLEVLGGYALSCHYRSSLAPVLRFDAISRQSIRQGYAAPAGIALQKNRKLGELVLARGASWFMPAARVRPRGLSVNR